MEQQTIFFFPYLAGALGVALGIVWRDLNEKIRKLEKNICDVPTGSIQSDIATIKNDIYLIKKSLNIKEI